MAQHRCDETIAEISEKAKLKLSELTEHIDKDELESCVQKLRNIVKNAIAEYTDKLHRYPPQIVHFKYDDLQRRVKESIEPLFNYFCSKIEKNAFKIFELDFQKTENFSNETLNEYIQRSIVFYRASIQGKYILIIVSITVQNL